MPVNAKPARVRGRLLSFKEACAHLGDMPEKRLRRLVAAKKIPHYYDGRLFFMSAELDAWLESHRTAALDEQQSVHLELARTPKAEPACIQDLMPRTRRLSVAG